MFASLFLCLSLLDSLLFVVLHDPVVEEARTWNHVLIVIDATVTATDCHRNES
jgi:hypothetical protein